MQFAKDQDFGLYLKVVTLDHFAMRISEMFPWCCVSELRIGTLLPFLLQKGCQF